MRGRALLHGLARTTLRGIALSTTLAVAGCAGTGGWSKPGADQAATASAYEACQAAVDTATKTAVDIDQDISATRSSDLSRGDILRTQMQQTQDNTRERADAILSSCMQAQGFTKGGK